jgi:hypothetical protein
VTKNASRQQRGLAKNWLTQRNINFCLATQQLLLAGHYKFGDNNNNELLIINLAAIPAGRISNSVLRQALNVGCKQKLTLSNDNYIQTQYFRLLVFANNDTFIVDIFHGTYSESLFNNKT